MTRPVASVIAVLVACRGPAPQPPVPGAGGDRDDEQGLLGRASSQLMIGHDAASNESVELDEPSSHDGAPEADVDDPEDDPDVDTDPVSDRAGYGGASYGAYVVPRWRVPDADRSVPYTQKAGLRAAIEGVVSWRGPRPPRLTSACGPVESLRVSADRRVSGVLVYIERISVGRILPHDGGERRPSSVGGVIVKRGCTLAPAVQVVAPLPAAIAIHGDGKPARLVVIAPAPAPPMPFELQEGGRIELQARPGITQVVSENGSLGAAWVVGLETPYYAITDDDGRFRIDELAPGAYEVTFWQPPLAKRLDGKLAYGAPIKVRRSIRVDATRTTRLDVAFGH